MKRFFGVLLILMAGFLAGCRPAVSPPEPPVAGLVRLSVSDYPLFYDDMDLEGLTTATHASLDYLNRIPGDTPFRFGADTWPAAHLKKTHTQLLTILENTVDPVAAVSRWVRESCLVYRASGREHDGRVLFTGYYEPLLRGSRYPSARFSVPVYGLPHDLLTLDLSAFNIDCSSRKLRCRVTADGTVVPYPDRAAIVSGGALAGTVPLVYLENPVDLFFLQIQGSGKVYLSEGGVVNLGYRETNGHPYKSIGKRLIDTGKITREAMSMQAIREYLDAHPEETESILNTNPSYVFFDEKAGGPYGCLGVPVTPGRSMAIDRRIFPSAALSYVKTEKPLIDGSGTISTWVPLQRFFHSQDTGGAIRGAGRADLFMGSGPYAEVAAGHLKHPGELYFMVLKPDGQD